MEGMWPMLVLISGTCKDLVVASYAMLTRAYRHQITVKHISQHHSIKDTKNCAICYYFDYIKSSEVETQTESSQTSFNDPSQIEEVYH